MPNQNDNRTVPGFTVYHDLNSPTGESYHCHEYHEVIFFLSGEGRYVVEGKTYRLQPGDLLVISDREIHRDSEKSGKRRDRYIAYIDSTFLEEAKKAGLVEIVDPMNDYIDSILSFVDIDKIKAKKLKILLDPMFGVSKTSLQTILLTCRCDVDVINDRHDTLFGGRLPSPSAKTLTRLSTMVVEGGYDLGIATDGEDRSGTIVTVPNLVGTEWSNAQVQLNIQGLKHQLQESQSSQSAAPVTYQYPHAGSKVPYGTTIYLYTDTYEGSHTEVPDVTGKSPDFARQMLSAAGLNCVVEGSGTVQAQSDEPGSSVQRGTIITLTCG